MGNSLFDDIREMFESSTPEKEPENYGEFRDRIIKDIGAAFPGLKGAPEPKPEGEGEGEPKTGRKPDQPPKETHPFFKSFLKGKEE